MTRFFISRCDNCGNADRLIVIAHTAITGKGRDWEDSLDWFCCLPCAIKNIRYSARNKLKRRVKFAKTFFELRKTCDIKSAFKLSKLIHG